MGNNHQGDLFGFYETQINSTPKPPIMKHTFQL